MVSSNKMSSWASLSCVSPQSFSIFLRQTKGPEKSSEQSAGRSNKEPASQRVLQVSEAGCPGEYNLFCMLFFLYVWYSNTSCQSSVINNSDAWTCSAWINAERWCNTVQFTTMCKCLYFSLWVNRGKRKEIICRSYCGCKGVNSDKFIPLIFLLSSRRQLSSR